MPTTVIHVSDYSVYKRCDSPFWWIGFRRLPDLKWSYKSSKIPHADSLGYKRALDLARRLGEDARVARLTSSDARWDAWVQRWIAEKFTNPQTLRAESHRWRFVHAYLTERKIYGPMGVTYNVGHQYLAWRLDHKTRAGRGSYNNALGELRLLGRVMREAVRRGFVIASPLERMGFKRHAAPEKPEITDAEVAAIRAELLRREGALPIGARWMTICFEIALHQGCRLSETSLPMDSIDLAAGTIRFIQKGRRVFTTRLHDALHPLIAELRAAGAITTCTLPHMAAKHWHWFFKGRFDKGHHQPGVAARLCFHCTRVTVITRMARAGVPIQQAMAYVGHADSAIHRIYQRLAAPDLSRATAALTFPESSHAASRASSGLDARATSACK